MTRVNIIQRAFEIAPECGSIEEVRQRLAGEGYSQVGAHLTGAQIRREIAGKLNPLLAPPHRKR